MLVEAHLPVLGSICWAALAILKLYVGLIDITCFGGFFLMNWQKYEPEKTGDDRDQTQVVKK